MSDKISRLLTLRLESEAEPSNATKAAAWLHTEDQLSDTEFVEYIEQYKKTKASLKAAGAATAKEALPLYDETLKLPRLVYESATLKIMRERGEQIKKGYTPEGDVGHANRLTEAARCYALLADSQLTLGTSKILTGEQPPSEWPWRDGLWHPSADPVRNLVKAGALIAAAIDAIEEEKANG